MRKQVKLQPDDIILGKETFEAANLDNLLKHNAKAMVLFLRPKKGSLRSCLSEERLAYVIILGIRQ